MSHFLLLCVQVRFGDEGVTNHGVEGVTKHGVEGSVLLFRIQILFSIPNLVF
jgi:hypothetical protein